MDPLRPAAQPRGRIGLILFIRNVVYNWSMDMQSNNIYESIDPHCEGGCAETHRLHIHRKPSSQWGSML